MTQPSPSGEQAGAGKQNANLSGATRMLLLVAGFALLGGAVLLLLFGSRFLQTGETQGAGTTSQLEPLVAGTPRTVDPPLSIAPAPQPGDPAPAFLLPDLQGEDVSLAQYRGQPVIINFWATWCAPCIFEMPELQEAYEAHQESGLVVLGLNRDEEAPTVQDFLANDLDVSLTFPILLDEHAVVADSYGILNMPTTYFVDPDGIVSAVHRGPLTLEQIETYLAAMS